MTAAVTMRVSLPGEAGAIEAIAEHPGSGSAESGVQSFAVLCHPHPLFGGTMENKVITTLARAFHESGIPTLRFNFRGVGASAGVFDDGNGESRDTEAAASWGRERWPGRRLMLAGFSFGAYVALRVSASLQAARLITVAPPVGLFDFTHLRPPPCPWLIVQGDGDDVVDAQSVISWARSLDPPPQIEVMPGAGHYFHGRLPELRQAAIAAIRSG